MSLFVQTDTQGHTLIVRLAGELDHHTAETVRNTVDRELQTGKILHLIINLSELSFMDSSGLGVMLGRYKIITQAGGKMAVCAMNDSVRKLFEMSGMFKILSVYDNESEAMSNMREV